MNAIQRMNKQEKQINWIAYWLNIRDQRDDD